MLPPYHLSSIHQHQPDDRKDTDRRAVMYTQPTKPAHPKASLPCLTCRSALRTTIAHSPEGRHLGTVSRSYVCRKPAQAVNPCHSKAIESDIPLGMEEVYIAWVAAARLLLAQVHHPGARLPAIVQVHLACKCGPCEARIRIWALHCTGASKCWSDITPRWKGGMHC